MDKKKRKILLFEDDYESMHYLKNFLEGMMSCAVVLTAEESILDRLGTETFDLVMVDTMIHTTNPNQPGPNGANVHFEGVNWKLTGLAFLQHLRQGDYVKQVGTGTSKDVPVIVLSAVAKNSGEMQTGQMLAQGYLEKPFRLDDLITLYQKLLPG
jgi:CheY-like chemotaxis protein